MTEFQYLNQGNSEAQDRLATSFLLSQSSTGLARTGVFTGLSVAQTTTASTAVLVNSGAGNSQDTVGNGAAVMVNDTQKTLDILTANPMGGVPRNDIVVFDSNTTSIRAIIGVPNASPADPTVPSTAIPLARIRNLASATTIPAAQIDDLRSFIVLFNQPTKVASLAARNALPSPQLGDRVMRMDAGGAVESYNGVAWGAPFADFYRGTGGTIPTATWTVLGFPNQVTAEGGLTCSSGIFTAPIAGLYRCAANITFPGAAGLTQVGSMINLNGSTFAFGYGNASTVSNWSYEISREIRLAAGDQISFSAFHNATSALATATDIHSTFAQVKWASA